MLYRLILLTNALFFSRRYFGSGHLSKGSDVNSTHIPKSLIKSYQEYGLKLSIFKNFDMSLEDFGRICNGKMILDFGSGYGGKTVGYGQLFPSASIIGVEPFEEHISISNSFLDSVSGVSNVRFALCNQHSIPISSNSVDIVFSHDVLEHVENPIITIAELHRVLKPGGTAFIILPPYKGFISHHLNYVTMLPCLHWFFSPNYIISQVNKILTHPAYSKIYNTKKQPTPKPSPVTGECVLPTLNGLNSDSLHKLLSSNFQVIWMNKTFFKFRADSLFHKMFLWLDRFPIFADRFVISTSWVVRARDKMG
jgi:ubiquinone/menaquinone biosynthesis C-methylase UbiE